MSSWSRAGVCIGGLWLAACTGDGNIGADTCPQGARCELRHVRPSTDEIAVETKATLEPVWKASELRASGQEARPIGDSTTIAAGPDGGLWLFSYTRARLEVMLLDADANVVGESAVEPPAGIPIEEGFPLTNYGRAASHERGPVIALEWGIKCGNFVPSESVPICTSAFFELIVFGTSVDETPARVFPFGPKYANNRVQMTQRSRDGDAIFIVDMQNELVKLDLRGDELWRRKLSADQFGRLPADSTGVHPSLAAMAPDGSISFGVMRYERRVDTLRTYPGGVLSVGDDGGLSLRWYEDQIDGLPTLSEAAAHSASALAYDTRGRALVAQQTVDGDLLLMRLADDGSETFRFLREDYTDLWVRDLAVDPAGTVYLDLASGGRNDSSTLLCRVPEEGDPNCFSVASVVLLDIEAPAPGVVFGVTHQELLRFELE